MKDAANTKLANSNSFIRLSLRKPCEWKVALTTSVSSPVIVPPDIELWDAEQGAVLVDTSRVKGTEYVRSKSVSFTRVGVDGSTGIKERRGSRLWGGNRSNSIDPVVKRYNLQKDEGQDRSKSLFRKEGLDTLVSPGDCVRLRTPVMVARRVSLTRDSSSQTVPSERSYSTCMANGITTHHRKQHSDSIVCNNRRKIKNNVSFGRVDTIDDTSGISSSFSLMRSRGTSNLKSAESEGSTPKVTITEVTDNGGKTEAFQTKNRGRARQRSKSGIPVLTRAQTGCVSENGPINCNKKEPNKTFQNVRSGRKSRMELFMLEDTNNHRFNLVRNPEPPPLVPPSAFSENSCHCNRGKCPLTKYFPEKMKNVNSQREINKSNSYRSNNNLENRPKEIPNQNINCLKKISQNKEAQPQRYERNRSRKKRVPSRSRMELMSSSSESDELMYTRHPPWRTRRLQNMKGGYS